MAHAPNSAGFIREAACPYNAGISDQTAMPRAGFVNVNIDELG
jgi:hypothetical protein